MTAWLLDAGPLIAALNRRDPDHESCRRALDGFSGSLLTTGAVISEVMYFVGEVADAPEVVAVFVDEADVEIHDCFTKSRLRAAAALMAKYADTPMDFADATLVLLAEDTGIGDVLTLDRRGFRTFRYRGSKRFRLVLDSNR